MRVFNGLADRVVVASSCDVYRAFGRLHRTEPGPPDPVPLTEDSPLREKLSLHGKEYEKRWVEDVVLGEVKLPATVLRLPAIHGPGDYRPFEYLKRMEDGRSFILLDQEAAGWQFSRGYAENVAHALVLAATNEAVTNRIYNVADTTPPRELDWIQFIGKAAGWKGRVIEVLPDDLPKHLKENADFNQHLTVDTTRIRNELGYQEVVPPFEGMKRTVAWIRAHPPRQIDLTTFDYSAEDSALERLARA
jgi:nucleoside-diphosphate-sugar epimerase